MKVLEAVKRVVDYNVKVRVKADNSGVDLANVTAAFYTNLLPEGDALKDPAVKSLVDGIQLTEREFLNALEKHGIAKIEPHGERFDPNKDQAMFEVPNEEVPNGTVVQVVQPGYVIADRVLRPAMVGVSKGGPKAAPKPDADA